jgi:hypothetical protein
MLIVLRRGNKPSCVFSKEGMIKLMLTKGELFVVLRRQINFERDQNAAAIEQTTLHDRLVDRYICCMISKLIRKTKKIIHDKFHCLKPIRF